MNSVEEIMQATPGGKNASRTMIEGAAVAAALRFGAGKRMI